MTSCHKATKRDFQTLSPCAWAAPVGSLRIACVLSLQGVLVPGVRGTGSSPDPKVGRLACDTGTDQRISLPDVPPWGFIRDLHICLACHYPMPNSHLSIADR